MAENKYFLLKNKALLCMVCNLCIIMHRKECIFTIDPSTARDLDDALSCKRLPDGKLKSSVMKLK